MRTWFRARSQARAEAKARSHAKTEARTKARAQARVEAQAQARARVQARAKARMNPIFWETSYYRHGIGELDGKLYQSVTPITVTHYREPRYCHHVEKAWVDRIEHADHIPGEDWYAAYCPCGTRIAEMIVTGINEHDVFRIAEIKRVIKKIRSRQAEQL